MCETAERGDDRRHRRADDGCFERAEAHAQEKTGCYGPPAAKAQQDSISTLRLSRPSLPLGPRQRLGLGLEGSGHDRRSVAVDVNLDPIRDQPDTAPNLAAILGEGPERGSRIVHFPSDYDSTGMPEEFLVTCPVLR